MMMSSDAFVLIKKNKMLRTIIHNMVDQLISECSKDKELSSRYLVWSKSLGLDPVKLYGSQAQRTINTLSMETLEKVSKVINNTSVRLQEANQ